MKIVIRTRKVIVLYIAILKLCCIVEAKNYEKIVNTLLSAKVVRVVLSIDLTNSDTPL
jgi:hypothetical protein